MVKVGRKMRQLGEKGMGEGGCTYFLKSALYGKSIYSQGLIQTCWTLQVCSEERVGGQSWGKPTWNRVDSELAKSH